MRFLFDGANLREKAAPLTEGRPEDEYAYVEIDGERDEVDAYVTSWPPSSGYQCGTVGRYPVRPLVDGTALADFLESDEFRGLAKRIIAGTRIETVDGHTVGFADGDARAAETELAWRLRQLPDHEIALCTAKSWLSDQGGGFNRSAQQIGENVERVFHSLEFSLGAHSIAAPRH